MVMALTSLVAQAQECGYTGYIDELDLIGKWSAYDYEGDVSKFGGEVKFEYMALDFKESGEVIANGFDLGWISDYFISNTNKLHFVIAAKSRRYIIWDYIKDEILVLGTFDRQNLLFLRKINSASIRKVTNTINIDNAKYNLQGVKVDDPEGIYIQNGQKYIAK